MLGKQKIGKSENRLLKRVECGNERGEMEIFEIEANF